MRKPLIALLILGICGAAFSAEPAASTERGEDEDAEIAEWKVLAEDGFISAQTLLADIYEKGTRVPQDLAESAKWYRMAAEQGEVSAQFRLGRIYLNREGVSRDIIEAVKWLSLAAEQEHQMSQILLRAIFEEGEGVPFDAVEAVLWLRRAASEDLATDNLTGLRDRANGGDADAQYRLGLNFATGIGVPADGTTAARWLRLAAEQGHPSAQTGLGLFYLYGVGVPEDSVEAYAWVWLAGTLSEEDREEYLSVIEEELDEQQIAEANQLGRERLMAIRGE